MYCINWENEFMNYADKNGFVYGKVKKTKDGTYHVSYLSPEGYFNPCKSLGEYATKKIAEQKLDEYHDYMTNARLKAKQESNQEFNRMTFFHTMMIVTIIIGLITFGFVVWSCVS